ncbi:MBL fold metallo-hydrolase [Sebaldella sp. S0638]|uniref:MBL fold metallo-hydrolase n=1 Tax=Sebaldella sp. S0638 TaxID=2957809 RepID=UPI0020A1D649|nr:MBL fold metallo-hydrolase [Sebaldella sp. S0638]MCP1224387.1 MBL fold metallo-hydrolase [Sebaldella sp. S0638]
MSVIKELKIDFISSGKKNFIYPTLIKYKNELILIDTGYPNMISKLEKAFQNNGESFSNLTRIWITHHDHDHIGSLHAIREKYPHIKVYAGAGEVPYIEGREIPLRMKQAVELQTHLSEEEQNEGLIFQKYLKSVEPDKVDFLLYDDMLLLDGNIKVIATPGHTKGHVSFYFHEEKTLIAGDALVIENNKLELPFPQFAENLETAKNSAKKLAQCPISKVLCYHGGTKEGSSFDIKKEILNAST